MLRQTLATVAASSRRAPLYRSVTRSTQTCCHFTAAAGSGLARSGQPRSRTVVLLCDMQQAFAGKFNSSEQVTRTTEYVLDGCSTLGVPVIVSEHQPEKLGETVPSLGAKVDALAASGLADKFYKTRFSMRGVEVCVFFGSHAPRLRACPADRHVASLSTADFTVTCPTPTLTQPGPALLGPCDVHAGSRRPRS